MNEREREIFLVISDHVLGLSSPLFFFSIKRVKRCDGRGREK